MAIDNLKDPPQMVLNHHTKRFTNVSPYFNYLHERCNDSPNQLDERIDEVLRFVSLNFDKDTEPFELKNVMSFLFELRDMFSSMQEFKSS